jgi:hypothetical protein
MSDVNTRDTEFHTKTVPMSTTTGFRFPGSGRDRLCLNETGGGVAVIGLRASEMLDPAFCTE